MRPAGVESALSIFGSIDGLEGRAHTRSARFPATVPEGDAWVGGRFACAKSGSRRGTMRRCFEAIKSSSRELGALRKGGSFNHFDDRPVGLAEIRSTRARVSGLVPLALCTWWILATRHGKSGEPCSLVRTSRMAHRVDRLSPLAGPTTDSGDGSVTHHR